MQTVKWKLLGDTRVQGVHSLRDGEVIRWLLGIAKHHPLLLERRDLHRLYEQAGTQFREDAKNAWSSLIGAIKANGSILVWLEDDDE